MAPPIGIYQPFFKPELIERLDPGFIALNWLSNPTPTLRELALHRYIADNKIYTKHQLTGLLSAKFFSKTKLDSRQVHDWISGNPGFDVYLFNGLPHIPYAGYNNVERAKINRSASFEILMRTVCTKIGLELPEEFPRQTNANLCGCNYWVASARFWEAWDKNVITPLFDLMGKSKPSDEIFRLANYSAPKPVYELTFIYEQLVDHYIAQRKIKAAYYPWIKQSILSLHYQPSIRKYLEEMIPIVDRIDAAGPWTECDKVWLRDRYVAVRLGGSAKETLASDPSDFDLPRFYPEISEQSGSSLRGQFDV
jgi:hypothetical protein